MRTILALALSLAAGFATMYTVAAHAAPPAGSCLGGCLPQAPGGPTPTLPVGYECTANWPMWPVHVPCAVEEGRESNYTFVSVSYKGTDGKTHTRTERQ